VPVEIIVHVEVGASRVGIEHAHLNQVFLLDSDNFKLPMKG
jgi:hypothetical protein